MERFKEQIASCFQLLEEKLGNGPISSWDTNDFGILSKAIHEETGTLLSVSTLKRLSGRVGYTSKPNKTTLNALAKYVGFEDWSAFANHCEGKVHKTKKEIKIRTTKNYLILFVLLGAALSLFVFFPFTKSTTTYDPNDFSFNVKSVGTGLPNSVIFKYDATPANDKAIIEIQQDWDERKRVLVSKNDSVSTSIYYHPGYFKSKLVVDGTIVKEKDVLIPTPDWVGVIETDSIPIYLDRLDYQTEDGLSIKADSLGKYGVDPRASRVPVGLYQIKDFGAFYTTDFEMTVSVRNDFKSGKSHCQTSQITLMHEDGPISIVLTDKGCVSDIMLYAFDRTIDGKKADLSNFGVDFTDFVSLQCISKDGILDILLDGISLFSFEVPETPKKILGLSVHFEGAGSVEKVELKNKNGIVYASTF